MRCSTKHSFSNYIQGIPLTIFTLKLEIDAILILNNGNASQFLTILDASSLTSWQNVLTLSQDIEKLSLKVQKSDQHFLRFLASDKKPLL